MRRPAPEAAAPTADGGHLQVGGWSLWPVAAVRSAGMPFAWLDAFGAADAGDEAGLRRRSADACRAMVMRDRFAAAVQWQNPALVRNWLGAYRAALTTGDDPASVPLHRRDQRETLIATLAQRYCAKNETIGFFGPVAWARFGTQGSTKVSGSGKLKRRQVFLERYAVAAAAASLADDSGLRPWLPLRRHPLYGAHGDLIYGRREGPMRATATSVRIVALLTHPRAEQELRALVDAPDFDSALASLEAESVVVRDLPVPVTDHPDRWLRDHLRLLPESPARDRAVARLARLGSVVDEVAESADEPAALGAAMTRLETALSAVICRPQDGERRRYGRTAVYEDCRLDLDVRIGSDLLASLQRPLALLLGSARWLVTETGSEVIGQLRRVHAALAAAGRTVSLAQLTLAGAEVLSGAPGTAVHRVVDDFTARWAEILELADSDGRLDTDQAQALARALFPDPGPFPWQAARQCSPDLMLRSRPDLLPQWVLGELHLGLNTLENRPFATQSDNRQELLAASRRDYPLGRIVPVWPASSEEVTSRTYPPLALDLPDHYDYWSYTLDEGHPAGLASWPGSMLLVTADQHGLWAGPPDAGWRRPVAEFLGEFLTALVVNRFRVRPAAPHHTRLLFDDVIVERESWTVPVTELGGQAGPADYGHRNLAAALRSLGCPRYVFASLTGQPKPVLVDLEAPLLLRAFGRLLRKEPSGHQVRLVEMVPEPTALWLRDSDGEPVTSEFRMVVAAPATAGDAVALPARFGGAP